VRPVRVEAWGYDARCVLGHDVEIYYTLPDYGDAPALYQCPVSGDLFAVSPDAEQYIGPAWSEKRNEGACPTCREPVANAHAYPSIYRCTACGTLNHSVPPAVSYPPEKDRRELNCWDPYLD
jgi:hypothetical protein